MVNMGDNRNISDICSLHYTHTKDPDRAGPGYANNDSCSRDCTMRKNPAQQRMLVGTRTSASAAHAEAVVRNL
jgi:hypothetical protein